MFIRHTALKMCHKPRALIYLSLVAESFLMVELIKFSFLGVGMEVRL